jgi:hypothetical protein
MEATLVILGLAVVTVLLTAAANDAYGEEG